MQDKIEKPTQNRTALVLIISLFFLWAFLHNINPILIPHLKKACQLTDTQSAFIDTAVYIGYFTIALPAGWFMHPPQPWLWHNLMLGHDPGLLVQAQLQVRLSLRPV